LNSRWLSSAAALILAASLALVMAASAGAATVRISFTGSVTTNPSDPAIIDLAAASDLGGANPTGNITLTSPTVFGGATTNVFHGDISLGGCVRIQGNQAIIVAKLPAGEEFTFTGPPSFGPITHVAAVIEDNGNAGGTPVDRAAPVWLKNTTAANWCTTTPFATPAGLLTALDAGDASFGYLDLLDGFPGNPDSTVSVVNPNGLTVTITDEPDGLDGQGLNVAVGAGSGKAKLSSCGGVVNVSASSTAILTCASLIVEVVIGSAEVVLGDGLAVVSIPEGGKAEVADDGSGGYTVENLGPVAITITVDGVEGTIEPGETDTVEAWDFQGFFQPVDAMPVLNQVTAGKGVPLKWRVLDASGAPVTDLSTATITVGSLDCESGEGVDQIEQALTNGSALQNLGDGYYQLNWKTLKSYAGTCKTMHLDIGDGVTHDAYFKFK
jgi:hypothetical protein